MYNVTNRWPEVVTATAKLVVETLTSVFTRNGFLRVLVANNGTQFVGKKLISFCNKHHIKKVHSAPYRSQSNGLVERLHGKLVPIVHKYLKTRVNICN